jgi:hypothetical protein
MPAARRVGLPRRIGVPAAADIQWPPNTTGQIARNAENGRYAQASAGRSKRDKDRVTVPQGLTRFVRSADAKGAIALDCGFDRSRSSTRLDFDRRPGVQVTIPAFLLGSTNRCDGAARRRSLRTTFAHLGRTPRSVKDNETGAPVPAWLMTSKGIDFARRCSSPCFSAVILSASAPAISS